jgi:fatty-acyl-CoA synthase
VPRPTQKTGEPGGPATTWSYHSLLQGIHQTANLLHQLGVGPQDAVAVLLPGGLAYHLALWGGEAAGIVQPLNPLLSEEKLLSLLQASQAKVLIAHGVDDDSQMRAKALRLQAQWPALKTVLLVHPEGEPLPEPCSPGTQDFHAQRQRQVSDRLLSGSSSRATSPLTSTLAAPPAHPSWPGTATVHRCSPHGPMPRCRAFVRAM